MNGLKLVVAAVLIAMFASCGNTEPVADEKPVVAKFDPHVQLAGEIKKLEEKMHQSPTLDPIIAGQALLAYSNFTTQFPTDSLTPDYLFKSGEIATATMQYPQALKYYETITNNYPNYKMIKESLYLQGMLLDNYLNQDDKAKVIYEAVIAKYPTTSYASDSKAAIQNLGKTDEQLIKEFEKKNKGK
jgi:tetratricopeptide (TPR) repeat protein